MNSNHSDNYVLGGNGFYFAALPAGTTGRQGAEGVLIIGNKILPVNGTGIELKCGLEFQIIGNTIDQIVAGNGITLDGTDYTPQLIKITDNWLGRQAGAVTAYGGLVLKSNVRDIISRGNTYSGWRDAGIIAPPGGSKRNFVSRDDVFNYGDPCNAYIWLDDIERVLISGASFSGPNSIIGGNNVNGVVEMCDFGTALPMNGIQKGLLYQRQRRGMATRSKGQVVMPSGGGLVTINHGLSYAPNLADITVTPNNSASSTEAMPFAVGNMNATSFTVAPKGPLGHDIALGWSSNIER